MQARPRSVENRVADALSKQFAQIHCAAVERIPVLGRAGPDITLNELNLVVDVKSRVEIPKALFFPLLHPFAFDAMTGARLKNLDALWCESAPLGCLDFSSKIVREYLAHMEEWTRANRPEGISCVVLHRPEMPIGESVALIYSSDRRRLIEYARHYSHNHVCAE